MYEPHPACRRRSSYILVYGRVSLHCTLCRLFVFLKRQNWDLVEVCEWRQCCVTASITTSVETSRQSVSVVEKRV